MSDNRPRGAARNHPQYFRLIPAAIVVTGLYFGRPVLLPLAIAILLAFALSPLVMRLRSFGVGRISSVLLSAMVTIGILVAIGFFVGNQLVQLADRLPLYQTNLVHKIQTVRGSTIEGGVIGRASSMLKTLRDQVSDTAPNVSPRLAARTTPATQAAAAIPVEVRQPEATPAELFMTIVGPLVGPLAAAGIVTVFVIFILLHMDDLRDRFIRLAGSGDIQRTSRFLDEGAEKLSHYLLLQSAINVSFGFVIGMGLWMIGIPSPVLWGLLATLMRFVPYIGVPLAAISPIVLALSVDPGWVMLVLTLLLFGTAEITLGQALEPALYGRRMGLSAVAIVVSATFWTWLWGPLGLLLSTPLTMCLMVLGRHIDHLQFLEVLLGDRPPLAVEEALYLRLLGDDADDAAGEAETFLKENTLCCYYDDVALKALGLAQADVNQGELDPERVAKISETTQDLIQNLSYVLKDLDSAPDMRDTAPEARSEPQVKSVLCVAGRGRLDEAAALLLIHLLEQRGIGARLIASTEMSSSNVENLDITDSTIVCLCYLDPGNLTRARYLMRRIRHRLPTAKIFAAFWGFDKGANNDAQTLGVEIVSNLNDAVALIEAATPGNNSSLPTNGPPRDQNMDEKRNVFFLAGKVQTVE